MLEIAQSWKLTQDLYGFMSRTRGDNSWWFNWRVPYGTKQYRKRTSNQELSPCAKQPRGSSHTVRLKNRIETYRTHTSESEPVNHHTESLLAFNHKTSEQTWCKFLQSTDMSSWSWGDPMVPWFSLAPPWCPPCNRGRLFGGSPCDSPWRFSGVCLPKMLEHRSRNNLSIHWLQEESTGNRRLSHEDHGGFPALFPLNQSIESCSGRMLLSLNPRAEGKKQFYETIWVELFHWYSASYLVRMIFLHIIWDHHVKHLSVQRSNC